MKIVCHARGARWPWMGCALLCAFAFVACESESPDNDVSSNNSSESVSCEGDLDCPLGNFCIEGTCMTAGDECEDDSACEEGDVCYQGHCVLFVGECEDDDGCEEGKICEDKVCRRGCREDAECAEGEACHQETLTCIVPRPECPAECPEHTACDEDRGECVPDGTCTEDSHCEGDLVCNEGACGELVPVCDRNEDCEDGFFCNQEVNLCEEGCRESNECLITELCIDGECTENIPDCDADDLEPNDDAESAVAMGPGDSFEGLTVCDESDWFSFLGFMGDRLDLSTTFTHDDGNINMRLYDPSGEQLQLAAGLGDGERIERALSVTGFYTVEVYPGGRGTYNDYSIQLEIDRTCEADDFEGEEGNNEIANAASLEGLENELEGASICEGDEDWFQMPLYAGESLRADLSYLHAAGELELGLYGSDGELLMASSSEEEGSKSVEMAVEGKTDLWLKVSSAEPLINLYDLNTVISPAACEDDAEPEEGNNDPSEATPVAPGDDVTGQICDGDEDWYAVVLPAYSSLDVSLGFEASAGDLELSLLAGDGETLLLDGASGEGAKSLSTTTVLPGLHYLRVRGEGRSQNAYTLSLTSDDLAMCPADDAQEPNSGFEETALIEPGQYGGLILCEGEEEDWYSFELQEGQSVEAFALAAAEHGEVNISLFAPSAVDAESDPADIRRGDAPSKRVRARLGAEPGTWRVRVWSNAEEPVLYGLGLNIYDGALPLDCEFDDDSEPNDAVIDATRVPNAYSHKAIACPDNSDWYRLEAKAGEQVSVRLDFSHAMGNVQAELFEGMDIASAVAEGESEDDGEILHYQATQDGPLYVRVHLEGESEGALYHLTSSTIAGSPERSCIFDDDFEPNDDYDNASNVIPGVYQGIRCAEDDDYYGLSVEAGQVVRAVVIFDGDGPLEMSLLNDDLETVSEAPMLESSVRALVHSVEEGGSHALAIRGSEGDEVEYALHFEVLDASPELCETPDAQEPNDGPDAAMEVSDETDLTGLSLCGGDEDWFRVVIPERATFQFRAIQEAGGDLSLELYEENGGGLASSYSSLDSEWVMIPRAEDERVVYVRAFLESGEEVSYDLLIESVAGPVCSPDEFEPNNSVAAARTLRTITYNDMSLCEGDEDWFIYSPADPFSGFRVVVDFDHDDLDINVEAIDTLFGVVLDSSTGAGDREVVSGSAFGEVVIRVYSAEEGSASYSIKLE